MSSGSPAVPGAGSPWIGRASAPSVPAFSRPVIRLIAFSGLALYGTVRWGTLLAPAPTSRLVGLVAIALLLAALGPLLAGRSRVLAVIFAVLAAVAMLAVCGLPLHWIRHLRIAVSARAIGNGLSALPALLVPYRGTEQGVRMVLLMGAAVLLFDAALMAAFAMPTPWRLRDRAGTGEAGGEGGDLRRAVAALPLIALAAVPLTLVPARLPYVQGFFVFVLLATLVWGERLPRSATPAGVVFCAVAVAGAMVLAPALDSHKPWINYRSLAGDIGGNAAEAFNWNQGYGPLNWPQNARQVLEVKATSGDYWKAENLDVFNGTGWSAESAAVEAPAGGVTSATLKRWTQRITVTLDGMTTTDIIGPGELADPTHSTEPVTTGVSAGRYVAMTQLGPGDTYTVKSYSPHPTAAQLAAAGTAYPGSQFLDQELTVTLPPSPASTGYGNESTVFIPPYGSGLDVIQSDNGQNGAALLAASRYERVYALAQSLKAGTTTAYQFVENVKRYLQHGYAYDQNPPDSPLPLVSFLFQTKVGYCQQFAGAMALLLRFGGVPARVAVGFTRGQYNANTHRWDVTDFDAHAWVEAFFPGYGWVEFDPTPASAPALAKTVAEPTLPAANAPKTKKSTAVLSSHGLGSSRSTTAARASHGSGGSSDLLIPALIVLLVLAGAGIVITRPLHRPELEDLVAELERAFARTGRPITPEVTLNEIEHRLEGTPGAEAYVRRLRHARYADEAQLPTAGERRALRTALRSGLGIVGALRALWAVPPRRPPVRRAAGAGEEQTAGIH